MNPRLRKVLNYILDRFGEPSTWRGVTLIASALGAYISPDKMELIIAIGLFVSGLVGVAFADKLQRRDDSYGGYGHGGWERSHWQKTEETLDNIEIPENER